MDSHNECVCLSDIMRAQIALIRKHIDDYKWYRGISDENQGITSFISEYAQLMRDCYCKLCENSKNCKLKANTTADMLDISDDKLKNIIFFKFGDQPSEMIDTQLCLLKLHLPIHKWIYKFKTYELAANDFLDKFNWIIKDLYDISKGNIDIIE